MDLDVRTIRDGDARSFRIRARAKAFMRYAGVALATSNNPTSGATRVTSNGDTRVTSTGDTRVTD